MNSGLFKKSLNFFLGFNFLFAAFGGGLFSLSSSALYASSETAVKEKVIVPQNVQQDPDYILSMGFYYYNNMDYDKATQFFEKYNDLVGDSEVALIQLGKIYLNINRLDRAKGYFERALQKNPRSITSLEYLSDIYLNEKDDNSAIRTLKAIEQIDPLDEKTLYILAEIYRQKKERRMSMVYYKKLSLAILKSSSNVGLLIKAYGQIARYYYDQQDYGKALEYYKKITEVNPSDPNSLYIYGELLKLNGKFFQSANVMLFLHNNDPSNISILESLIESFFVLGDYRTRSYVNLYLKNATRPEAVYKAIERLMSKDWEQASSLFKAVAKKYPNRLSSHIGLYLCAKAELEGQTGNNGKAGNNDQIIKEAYSVVVLAQKIRAYDVSLRYMDIVFHLLERKKSNSPDFYRLNYSNSMQQVSKEQYKIANEYIDSYYTHGITLENTDNPRQAIAYYLKSLAYANNLIKTYEKNFNPVNYIHKEKNMYGLSHVKEKADSDIPEKLKLLKEKKYEVLLNLDWALTKDKNHFQLDLSRFLSETRDTQPDDPKGYFISGLVSEEKARALGDNKETYTEAKNYFLKAISRFEDISEKKIAPASYYFYAGMVCDKLDEFEQMEFFLKKAIEIEPNNSSFLNYLGYVYSEKNTHLDEAMKYISRAIEDDPENDAYVDTLGWIYFKMEKYEEALSQLLVAHSLSEKKDRNDPVIDFHIAETYQKLGNIPQSIRFYKSALENVSKASDTLDQNYIKKQIQSLSQNN